MAVHTGPVLALMALLAVAGVTKLRSPGTTAGALEAAGFPHSRLAVRLLGLFEVAVGLVGIVRGGWVASFAGAVLYASFALFVFHILRNRLSISSCGCLGAAETPPSIVHVVVNLAAAATLVYAMISPIGPWGGLAGAPLGESLPLAAFTGVTIYLLYAVIAVLPRGRAPRSHTPIGLSPTRARSNP